MHLIFGLISTILRRLPHEEEDVTILQRIVKGEESALADLYDRYGRILYTLGMRMLRSTSEAEDVVQDVFLQVWGKADYYQRSKGSVYTWLVTMMRNRAIDRMRSK